jgi:hypothetical protein
MVQKNQIDPGAFREGKMTFIGSACCRYEDKYFFGSFCRLLSAKGLKQPLQPKQPV